jgi:hypothetical protein
VCVCVCVCQGWAAGVFGVGWKKYQVWCKTYDQGLVFTGCDVPPVAYCCAMLIFLFLLETLIVNLTAPPSFNKCNTNPQTQRRIWETRIFKYTAVVNLKPLSTFIESKISSYVIYFNSEVLMAAAQVCWCRCIRTETLCAYEASQSADNKQLSLTVFVQLWREDWVILYIDKRDACKVSRRYISAVGCIMVGNLPHYWLVTEF